MTTHDHDHLMIEFLIVSMKCYPAGYQGFDIFSRDSVQTVHLIIASMHPGIKPCCSLAIINIYKWAKIVSNN